MTFDEINIQTIDYFDLTEKQLDEYDALLNETISEGQFFWIENNEVFACENKQRALWEARNAKEIESGKIILIV